jgi:uncharacterized protein YggT (Ycf19 family)
MANTMALPQPPNHAPRKREISLDDVAPSPDDEIPLESLTDSIQPQRSKGEPSFRDLKNVELAQRTTPRRPRVQVVNWQQEKESFNLLLKTDKGLWTLAKAISFVLGIRLLLSLLGANRATSFNSFLHEMTQPLVRPFERLTQSVSLGENRIFETPALLALASVMLGLGLVAKVIGALGKR